MSCDEARRPGVGGMKPSSSIRGHKAEGGEVQYTATGTSPLRFASSAIDITRLIPASTHARRATDQKRGEASCFRIGGARLTGHIACLATYSAWSRAGDLGTPKVYGSREASRGEKECRRSSRVDRSIPAVVHSATRLTSVQMSAGCYVFVVTQHRSPSGRPSGVRRRQTRFRCLSSGSTGR